MSSVKYFPFCILFFLFSRDHWLVVTRVTGLVTMCWYIASVPVSVDKVMVGHTTSPRPRVAVLGGGIIGRCVMS